MGIELDLTKVILRSTVFTMRYQEAIHESQIESRVGRYTALLLYMHRRWDQQMMNHSIRVARYASQLATKLGLAPEDVERVEITAIVHDIGKLYVPMHILNKPGKLTRDEWEVIKRHPQDSKEILQAIPPLRAVAHLTACHHERWDGNGYPYGLRGREIPIESRIISIADAYDAMTSRRAYRPEMSCEQAAQELVNGSGKQFWPTGVEAFLEVLASARFSK